MTILCVMIANHQLVKQKIAEMLLGSFAKRLIGLSAGDSRDVVDLLQRHVTKLENTIRWEWQPGDVAMWDNRATQHYGVADYGDQHRVMRRITVAGDGGDIVYRGYRDGIVHLQMQGACSGCPSSTATLKHGIEGLLKHYIPEVTEVRAA